MKIVILAAGIGSRLGNPFPKPLTPLNSGETIMERQISALSKYFDVHDISIVVGFKKDLIMESFPDVSYVYNQFFDTTNTSKSLLKALQKYKDKSVLWLNGDVVFDDRLLQFLQPHIEADQSFISVNTSRVAEEEVKYTLRDDFVESLSKSVENGLGEAVGINFIAAQDLSLLISQLERCDDQDYFERGLEMAISDHQLKLKAVDISQYDCIEVDFKEDLASANQIF